MWVLHWGYQNSRFMEIFSILFHMKIVETQESIIFISIETEWPGTEWNAVPLSITVSTIEMQSGTMEVSRSIWVEGTMVNQWEEKKKRERRFPTKGGQLWVVFGLPLGCYEWPPRGPSADSGAPSWICTNTWTDTLCVGVCMCVISSLPRIDGAHASGPASSDGQIRFSFNGALFFCECKDSPLRFFRPLCICKGEGVEWIFS